MKLEDQVVTLETAKKLKELGVKQDSLFYFVNLSDPPTPDWHITNKVFGKAGLYYDLHKHYWIGWGSWAYERDEEYYSAFTVAELGEILPKVIHGEHDNYFLIISYSNMTSKENDGHWCIQYESYLTDEFIGNIISQETEAEARAKMLIYLIENKLI